MAERIKGYFLIIAITHPIYTILGALVYLSLPKSQQPERMPQAQQTGFAYGLCDGCGHPDVRICWFRICCHTVRWAANASSPKVNFFGLGFFPTLLIMEGSICLGAILICLGLAPFTWICSLVILVMYVLNRHKIRRVYGLPTWTCGSCMEDICCSLFCASCGLTVMQEALQLEFVGEPVALGIHGDRAGSPPGSSDECRAGPPFDPDGRRVEEGKPPAPSIEICC